MIGFLRGKIISKQPPSLLLDVNGVGYEVSATMATFYNLPDLGEVAQVFTHLAVSETSQTLYAFSSAEEKHMFRQLIKVSGIGSRSALTILSGISVEDFIYCVRNEDAATLVRLPGIGKKTAERLIIEMRDRIDKVFQTIQTTEGKTIKLDKSASPRQEAQDALVALGYKPTEVAKLLKSVDGDGLSTEEIIRLALQSSVKK